MNRPSNELDLYAKLDYEYINQKIVSSIIYFYLLKIEDGGGDSLLRFFWNQNVKPEMRNGPTN